MENRNTFIISRGFRNYFASSILLMIIEQVTSIIDMVLVGNFVCADAFSALDLCLPVENLVHGVQLLLTGGAGILASRHIGNQEFEKADKVLTISLVSSALFALIASVAALMFLKPLVGLLCSDATLAPHLESYLRAFFYGLIPMAIYASCSSILNVDGKPMIITLWASVACCVDLILDVVLMKFMGMGIEGQAYATIVSYILPVIAFIPYMASGKCRYTFRLALNKEGRSMFFKNIENGVSYCMPFMVSCLMLFVLNSIVLDRQGTDGLYVWSVGYQLFSVGLLFMDCLGGNVIVTMGSMLAGCRDTIGLKALLNRCLKITGLGIGAFIVLIMIFPGITLKLFGMDPTSTIPDAIRDMRLIALFLLPFCVVCIKSYFSMAVGRIRVAVISFTGMFVSIILAVFIWGSIKPDTMLASIPLAGFLIAIAEALLSAYTRKHKHPDYSPYFLIPSLSTEGTLYISIPYTNEGRDNALNGLAAFVEERNLEPKLGMGLNLCCEELMFNIQENNAQKGDGYFYDLFIIDDENDIKVTVKDAGQPFNPIRKFEKSAGQAMLEGDDQFDLSLQIVNSMCQELNYNYMYGQNVIFMTFRK